MNQPSIPMQLRPDRPDHSRVHKTAMFVGRKRYKLAVEVEMRTVTRGPAEVNAIPRSENAS